MIDRTRTDLPEPDSPTIPIVSPRPSTTETPSTARTTPYGVSKDVFRFLTLSSGG